MIICHHPPIFRPLTALKTDSGQGPIFEKLIKHDISVYAAHTNLDVAVGGVNDLLAEALDLQDIKVLAPTYEKKMKKMVVFVPTTHAEKVRKALGDAGAGEMGNYSHTSFTSRGEGRFTPTEGSRPFIGESGKSEIVNEVKIETIYHAKEEKRILQAMLQAHPYEEIAYDLIPLDNPSEPMGLGRIGRLEAPKSLRDFSLHVKEKLGVEAVRVVGDLNETINKVAVLGGDGNKYIHTAKYQGADVLVTGDLYFHTAHDSMMLGLHVVDPGHHVEKVMIEGVAEKLAALASEQKLEVNIIQSETDTNPFKFL